MKTPKERTCILCSRQCLRGVHFHVTLLNDAGSKKPSAEYDICSTCFEQRHPLVIPASLRALDTPLAQFDVRFELFGAGGRVRP